MASNRVSKGMISRFKPSIFWGFIFVLVLVSGIYTLADRDEKSIQEKTKAITTQLRCLECEGLSVYDSETQTSKTIASDVTRRLEKGQTSSEIYSYYESVYGEFIRLAPTTKSGNWLIYVLPSFFVVVLGFALFLSIRSGTAKRTQIIFWVMSGLLFVSGIVLFYSDSNRSVKAVEQTQQLSSEDLLKKSVLETPNNSNFRNLAIVQFANEDYVNALQNFDKAVELDPNDAASKGYGAYIVFLSKRYELALDRANDAVRTNSQDVTALFFRGLILFSSPESDSFKNAENIRRANLDFDEVLRLAPTSDFANQIKAVRNS